MTSAPLRVHLLAALGSLLLLSSAAATQSTDGAAKDAAFMSLRVSPWQTATLPAGHTAALTVNGRTIKNITRISTSPRRDGAGWITAERPVSKDGFNAWIGKARFGRIGSDAVRVNGSVIVYDSRLTPVRRYAFTNAWPVKVTGARKGDIAVETLTIAAEGLELR